MVMLLHVVKWLCASKTICFAENELFLYVLLLL